MPTLLHKGVYFELATDYLQITVDTEATEIQRTADAGNMLTRFTVPPNTNNDALNFPIEGSTSVLTSDTRPVRLSSGTYRFKDLILRKWNKNDYTISIFLVGVTSGEE